MSDENFIESCEHAQRVLGRRIWTLLIIAMLFGVILWGGFNWSMERTNSMDFCLSCHEMKDNVYKEYLGTVHDSNRSGVRATCPDCHVPRPWIWKVKRKIQASNEILHKILGSVDTPEKFDAKRLQLATNVWREMRDTDSRECRNCHDFGTMNPEKQKPRARKQHMNAMRDGNTCIDCHKGIAHKKVHDQLDDDLAEEMSAPKSEYIREVPQRWLDAEQKEQDEKEAEKRKKKEAARMRREKAAAKPRPALSAVAAPAGGGIDWSDVPERQIVLFYPGQSSIEWMLKGTDHGGARPFIKAGDPCTECHDKEADAMGQKIVTGEKLEPTVIAGKRGSIPVSVKAAHDGENLYMRYQWPDGEHAPAPFVDGGKMDPDNQMKLAVMFATDEVEYADRAGCWGTCHHDLRSMPHAPEADAMKASPVAASLELSEGVTKYIKESRTKIEVKGRRGKKRGGWDKLKEAGEVQAELGAGHFMDIVRYKSSKGETEDGHILEQRVMSGGQGVEFTGGLADGTWTMVMKRKLKSDKPGDLSLDTGAVYNFGFAVHDDYSNARFHHVSLGYKLGFDNEEVHVNAAKQ